MDEPFKPYRGCRSVDDCKDACAGWSCEYRRTQTDALMVTCTTTERKMDKRDFFKTAVLNGYNGFVDEYVGVEHIGDNHYKVKFQSGSVAFMPAEENGVVYLTRFCR
jgi:hypothetical protein